MIEILQIQKSEQIEEGGDPQVFINSLITINGETIFTRVNVPDFNIEEATLDQVKEMVKDHANQEMLMQDYKRIKNEKSNTYKHDGQSFRREVIIREWAIGESFDVDEMVDYNGTLYRAVQAHTADAENWNPEVTASLWSPILVFADEYRPWQQPLGAHDAYPIGSIVSHNDGLWISLVADNVWEPSTDPTLWEPYVEEGEGGGDPEEPTVEAWVQPEGAHDAYATGDRVTHNGSTWESNVDGNVWEPPTQWTEVTE